MKLKEVVSGLECRVYGNLNIDVSGVTHDSRLVKKGDIFVALKGHHVDGSTFIEDAVNLGAKAVVTDQLIEIKNTAVIVVSDLHFAMAYLSSVIYSHPDMKLLMIAVTGTNGKTTITYLLENILNKAGMRAGVIGTINCRYGSKVIPTNNTTPESSQVFKTLSDMKKATVKAAVMEVSSHALSLGRVDNIEFDTGIFTNLTRDHLDFHKDMEDYFHAKQKLFFSLENQTKTYPGRSKDSESNLIPKFAIINIDDPWGRKLVKSVKNTTIITYGIKGKADVKAKNIKVTTKGAEFTLVTPVGHGKVHFNYLGMYNVYNSLASVAAALSAGII
jgi:UDP-N-acetylmuramoyl-L-alanyl-D-glutamate--2,6-diaminopimelate ligase